MKKGLVIVFSDVMKESLVSVSQQGIKISKDFIPVDHIQSVTFTNKHPKINGVYTAYKNQTYCVIKYTCANTDKEITFQPVSNLWSDLRLLRTDKFHDETNGEPTKLSWSVIYGEGYKPSKTYKQFLVIWNIMFVVMFALSFVIQKQVFGETMLPILPFIVFAVFVSVDSVLLMLFAKKR